MLEIIKKKGETNETEMITFVFLISSDTMIHEIEEMESFTIHRDLLAPMRCKLQAFAFDRNIHND
jgi:hypothetical protein